MIELSAPWLMFVLGLRHGLDPDHVAVIDNIVFRMVDTQPRFAPWAGTFFALGHSLSVGIVAIGMSFVAETFALPAWIGPAVDLAVIALLVLIGSINLGALLRRQDYAPVGWRASLIPRRLRTSTHPAAVVAIGVIFGLVFDTITQAAAWGAAASARGGTSAALLIVAVFAAGMVLVDTLDSQVVSRLLRSVDRSSARVRRYRRAVGWTVVVLSYGMAIYAAAEMAGLHVSLPDAAFTALGFAAAAGILLMLVAARWRARITSRHSV